MKDLLKADLFKVRKSKIFLIFLIISVALPFIFAFGSYLINVIYMSYQKRQGYELYAIITGDTLIFSSVGVLQSFGIAIPICADIIIYSDTRSGILRNKVIYGVNRYKIYLSNLIIAILLNIVFITLYFLSTILFSSIFLPFGLDINGEFFLKLLISLVNGVYSFTLTACLTCFFIYLFNNIVPTIILKIVIMFGIEIIYPIALFIPHSNAIYLIPYIANYDLSITLASAVSGDYVSSFLLGGASCIVIGALLTLFGILILRKRDIK